MSAAVTNKKHSPRHYYALLTSVIVLSFIAPLVDHTIWSHILIGILLTLVLLFSALSVRSEEKLDWLSISLAVLATVGWTLAFCTNMVPFKGPVFQILSLGMILLFFLRIVRVMVLDLLTGSINSNRICGGACVYVLIGFCFALVHMMVAIHDPHAYRDNVKGYDSTRERHERYPLLIYFSFCTLSTVAYGDIIPVSRLARALSCLEAMSGQLYLAIMVARLVGMHTAVKAEPRRLEAEKVLEAKLAE